MSNFEEIAKKCIAYDISGCGLDSDDTIDFIIQALTQVQEETHARYRRLLNKILLELKTWREEGEPEVLTHQKLISAINKLKEEKNQ